MSPTAERIFEILNGQDFMSTETLARGLGLASARSLRGKDGEAGLLRASGDEIFREKGLVLIRRMEAPSGVKLSDDPKEVSDAARQWMSFGTQILDQARDYDKKAMMLGSTQLTL